MGSDGMGETIPADVSNPGGYQSFIGNGYRIQQISGSPAFGSLHLTATVDIIPIMLRVLTRLLHRSIVASFSGRPSRGQPRKPRGERGGERGGFHPRALAFPSWGPQQKNIPLESPGKGKGEVFTLRLPYSCSQRPKKRELRPAATVPPPPQRLVAPVPWNLTPAYFQGNQ